MCALKRIRNTSDQLFVTIYISLCSQTADPKYSEPCLRHRLYVQIFVLPLAVFITTTYKSLNMNYYRITKSTRKPINFLTSSYLGNSISMGSVLLNFFFSIHFELFRFNLGPNDKSDCKWINVVELYIFF